MSTASPSISTKLQIIINNFATTEPDIVKNGGLQSIEYRNLIKAIKSSPALITQLNDAVRLGYLKHFDIHDDPNSGAGYNAPTIKLGLGFLGDPAEKNTLMFQLSHEVQHAFFNQQIQNASTQFYKDIDSIAYSKTTQKDYTTPLKNMLSKNSEDEARAMIAGWNALVSYAKQNHSPVTLKDIFLVGSGYEVYFIDKKSTPSGDEYKLKPNLTLNSDMTMNMSSPNIKAMQKFYFDQDPAWSRLGANVNSDYTNFYAATYISYIAQIHNFASPKAKLMLDMKSLKLDEPLLEQNGLDLGSQKRIKYYDTKNPNVPLYFDHTVNGSNQNRYVPILREHLQEVLQNRELSERGSDLSHQFLIDEDALKGHFPLSDDIRSIGQAHQLDELQMHRISAVAHINLPSDRYSVAAVYLSKDEQTLNVYYENRFNAVTFMNKEFDFQQSIHTPMDQAVIQQQKAQSEQLNQTQTQNQIRL